MENILNYIQIIYDRKMYLEYITLVSETFELIGLHVRYHKENNYKYIILHYKMLQKKLEYSYISFANEYLYQYSLEDQPNLNSRWKLHISVNPDSTLDAFIPIPTFICNFNRKPKLLFT